MFDFHEKRKIRNLLFSKFTVVALLVLIGLSSVSVYERYIALRDISHKREIKAQELETLKKRASALDANVQYLKQGRGVEEELRKRFDVAKEGEQVVVIVGSSSPTNVEELSQPPGKKTDERTSWWRILKFW